MDAVKVKPGKWMWDPTYQPKVLFDDGEYSAVWGKFEGEPCLGVRYNETPDNSVGYPAQGSHPLWYREPDFLNKVLIEEFLRVAHIAGDKEMIENCEFAIEELKTK